MILAVELFACMHRAISLILLSVQVKNLDGVNVFAPGSNVLLHVTIQI
jgi:hypothetical protein